MVSVDLGKDFGHGIRYSVNKLSAKNLICSFYVRGSRVPVLKVGFFNDLNKTNL